MEQEQKTLDDLIDALSLELANNRLSNQPKDQSAIIKKFVLKIIDLYSRNELYVYED